MQGGEIRGHQPERFDQARNQARLGDGLMQEDAAVERLMLRTHDRKAESALKYSHAM